MSNLQCHFNEIIINLIVFQFSDCRLVPDPKLLPGATDPEAQEKLWNLSCEMSGLSPSVL